MIVEYRHWPIPKIDPDIHYLLIDVYAPVASGCTLKVKTNQYQLLNCQYISGI